MSLVQFLCQKLKITVSRGVVCKGYMYMHSVCASHTCNGGMFSVTLLMYLYDLCVCSEIKTYVQRQWRQVCVGDFVELECDEFIPADILLLATSDPHDICYIETANIDGETNLKQRTVVQGIVDNSQPLVR